MKENEILSTRKRVRELGPTWTIKHSFRHNGKIFHIALDTYPPIIGNGLAIFDGNGRDGEWVVYIYRGRPHMIAAYRWFEAHMQSTVRIEEGGCIAALLDND